jgi:hypothetical protein
MEDGRKLLEMAPSNWPTTARWASTSLSCRATREGGLHWTGLTHHPDPAHPLWPEEQVLNRLSIPRTSRRR